MMLRKSPPAFRPARRVFAQAGCPSWPFYDRKRIIKEGDKGTMVVLEFIAEGLFENEISA